ncbi:MAG TPA: zinc-ribbon domain-containing protein [Geobacteraceae bacterium]
MKIECPNCKLTGQVSDLSVPAEGRYMDCPRCKNSFFVNKIAPASWADTLTDCPRCGYSTYSGDRFDICPGCGLVAKDHSAQRGEQSAGRTAPQQGGAAAGGKAEIDVERMRQDLERVQREEEKKRRLHGAGEGVPMPDEQPVPESAAVPPPVRYLGWAFVTAGLLMVVWGGKEFLEYRGLAAAPAAPSEFAEPPGPARLYLGHGLLPTLQVLLGIYTVAAGSQFLKLRPWARKGVEAAAWGGIVHVAGRQLAKLIEWLRISSDSASFLYYFSGIADALLMTAIWSVPLLAAVWYLRGDDIGEAFEE